MIVVGTHDPIVDCCRTFARKLNDASENHVELFIGEAMPHGFYFWPDMFEEEREAYDAVADFLRRYLGTTSG